MFKTPYETTIGSAFVMKNVVNGLRLASVEGLVRPAVLANGTQYRNIFQLLPSVQDVPPFTQPVFNEGKWYIDSRAYLKPVDGGYQISNPYESDFLVIRAMLSSEWNKDKSLDFEIFQEFPAKVFIQLVSEAITNRLALGVVDQYHVQVLTGLYYLGLFRTDVSLDEKRRIALAQRIGTLIRLGADQVLKILDEVSSIPDNINEFCNLLKTQIQNPRMAVVNSGLLMTTVGHVWFGANSKETIAIALEYPPFWNALVYAALVDRSFHSARLSKMVRMLDRKQESHRFLRALQDLAEYAK